MAKTITFDANGIKKIQNGFMRVIRDSGKFFDLMAVRVDTDVQLMFKGLGKRPGVGGSGWKPFSVFTLHPSWRTKSGRKVDTSRWNKRYATDGSVGRYSPSSKMMQASGSFRRSFRVIKKDDNTLEYGTNYELAQEIMSGGGKNKRQVIVFSGKDEVRYRNLFLKYIKDGVKF